MDELKKDLEQFKKNIKLSSELSLTDVYQINKSISAISLILRNRLIIKCFKSAYNAGATLASWYNPSKRIKDAINISKEFEKRMSDIKKTNEAAKELGKLSLTASMTSGVMKKLSKQQKLKKQVKKILGTSMWGFQKVENIKVNITKDYCNIMIYKNDGVYDIMFVPKKSAKKVIKYFNL